MIDTNFIWTYCKYKKHDKNNYIFFNLMMISRALKLNRLIKYSSSVAKPKLTDYEYITKIQQNLLNNNINQALKYLVNSYLDGVILDMQVFKNYFLRVKLLEPGLTYEQIGYKIFRESFKPNLFMLEWMNSLAKSSNPAIISLLQKDFQNLKMQMPKVDKIPEEQVPKVEQKQKKIQKQLKQQSLQKKQERKESSKALRQKKVIEQKQKAKEQKNISLSTESISLKESIIKNFMDRLHETKSKLIVHNIVVEFNNNESIQIGDYNSFYEQMIENKKDNEKVNNPHKTGQNNNTSQYENENDDDEDFEYEQGDEFSIRKIKIGKIQIVPNLNSLPVNTDADK